MKRLRPFAVPNRFLFVDPDTQRVYKATSKEALFRDIVNYRSQNRLPPIQALEVVIENYWCSLPENCALCEDFTLSRGWLQYLKGGIALVENFFYGEKNMVPQAIAEERAAICLQCPRNIAPDKGPFLSWSDEIALASTGGRKTSVDDKLFSCEACTCVLKAKAHYRGPFSLSKEEKEKMPAFCWQLKE